MCCIKKTIFKVNVSGEKLDRGEPLQLKFLGPSLKASYRLNKRFVFTYNFTAHAPKFSFITLGVNLNLANICYFEFYLCELLSFDDMIIQNVAKFQYLLHSPQVKQNFISSVRNPILHLFHEVPYNLRLRILGNKIILAKSQNFMGTQQSSQFPLKK